MDTEPETSEKAEWVIESYVGNIGWSLSRLNEAVETHTLEWCMDKWNDFKTFGVWGDKLHTYRLRNVVTEDIILCAIL